MIQARSDTLEKSIHRTLQHRESLESKLATRKHYTKGSARKIDVKRETEILGKLMELRNAR